MVAYLAQRLFLRTPLPPGPRGLPILGSISDLPPEGKPEFLHWLKFKDRYGPISSLTVMGQPMIIINDSRINTELLEKRSAIYSSRMQLHFAHKMCGWGEFLANLEQNESFRATRRDVHSTIGTKSSVAKYYDIVSVEAHRFLLRTLQHPEGLVQHLTKEAGASILNIGYGYITEPHKNDALVDLANQALANLADAAAPGKWLVDTIPFIDNFPDWFPGMQFKQIARGHKRSAVAAVECPYTFAKSQIAEGKKTSSMVASLLAGEVNPAPDLEYRIKYSAAALYLGGADTVSLSNKKLRNSS